MNRPEAEQIASAISILRPAWLRTSLLTMLGRLPSHLASRPARDVMLALTWLAYDPEQETPRLLYEDGPWWNVASLTGPGTGRATEPGIVANCEHGERPSRCEACRIVDRRPPSAAQREAIRAAILAGREAMESRTRQLTDGGLS